MQNVMHFYAKLNPKNTFSGRYSGFLKKIIAITLFTKGNKVFNLGTTKKNS